MQLQTQTVGSPIGPITLVADRDSLVSLDFDGFEHRLHALLKKRYGHYDLIAGRDPGGASSCLERYFAGDLDAFGQLSIDPGGTPFQRAVWQVLRTIPSGTMLSYGELARRLGRAGAARAVGRANGLNPIAIVVPCHRVIGSNETLTGYAGGMQRKAWLLRHEGALVDLWRSGS